MSKEKAVMFLALLLALPLAGHAQDSSTQIAIGTETATAIINVQTGQPPVLTQQTPAQAEVSGDDIVGPPTKNYLRLMDVHNVEQSATVLWDPNGKLPPAGTTDVCLVTHSTKDGTIIPASLQKILPPEDFCALSVGAGGQFNPQQHGNAIIDFGLSVNVAPQVLGWTTMAITSTSPQWAQVYKAAIVGGGSARLRLGVGEVMHVVNGGTIAVNQFMPGHGFGDVLQNNLRLESGLAWYWGGSSSKSSTGSTSKSN